MNCKFFLNVMLIIFCMNLFACGDSGVVENNRIKIKDIFIEDIDFKGCIYSIAQEKKLTYADEITKIICNKKNIKSVKGIFNFINVAVLSLGGNNIADIDLAKNEKLQTLNLHGNKLKKIKITSNKILKVLFISNNYISEVDLSNNTSLELIDLSNNKLSNIDISKNINLYYVGLIDNFLNGIDVSNNIKLQQLYIANNNFKGLNLNGLPRLTSVYIKGNEFDDLTCKHLLSLNVRFMYQKDPSKCNEAD